MKTNLRSALFALLLTGCGGGLGSLVVRGNGNLTDEVRSATGFTRVESMTSLAIEVRQGDAFRVTSRIDSNLQQYVITEVSGETLVVDIRSPSGYTGVHFSDDAVVFIELPVLNEVRLRSSGKATVTGVDSPGTLNLVLDSSGGMNFSGTAPRIEARLNSSGGLNLSGSTEFLLVDVDSSGSVDARALPAISAELTTDSSGSIRATLAGGTVRLTVNSSGSIDWWGTATVLSESDTSSGSIHHHISE